MLNQNNDTLNDSTLSLTSSMSTCNLIHSNSASNLQSNNVTLIEPQSSNTFTSSKSIHSFSSDLHNGDKKLLDDKDSKKTVVPSSANNTGAITQFMKQSADNISKREISSSNNTMVSIGCQTISTGDVTVTNIYIE